MRSVLLVLGADVNVEVSRPSPCFEPKDGFLEVKIFS